MRRVACCEVDAAFEPPLATLMSKRSMYQYAIYLGLEGVPVSLLWGLCRYYLGAWSLWDVGKVDARLPRVSKRSRSQGNLGQVEGIVYLSQPEPCFFGVGS